MSQSQNLDVGVAKMWKYAKYIENLWFKKKQAGAELCQAQVKLEVIVGD